MAAYLYAPRASPWGQPLASLVLAIVVLGAAITFHFLQLDLVGVVLVTMVIGLTAGRRTRWRLGSVAPHHIVRTGVVFQLALGGLVTLRELIDQSVIVVMTAIVATAVMAVFALRFVKPAVPRSRDTIVFFGAVGVLVACWLSVEARIDVFVFQDVAASRLVAGTNPYEFGYPNYYDAAETARVYGPGLSVDGQLQAGFPYPPVSLLLSTAGWLVGDVRIAHAAALVTATALMMFMVSRSWASRVAGVLFVTSPLSMHVVRQGWTEPFLVATFALFLWRVSRGASGVVSLAAFLGVKQYAGLFLPLIAGLVPRPPGTRTWLARAAVAVLLTLVVVLPFAIWNLAEFLYSVALWQFDQPFRTDAMSIPSVLSTWLGAPAPWLQLGLMAAGTLTVMIAVVTAWERSWQHVALGTGTVMLVFLLLGKQAFTNYYTFALGALCLALSLVERGDGLQPL